LKEKKIGIALRSCGQGRTSVANEGLGKAGNSKKEASGPRKMDRKRRFEGYEKNGSQRAHDEKKKIGCSACHTKGNWFFMPSVMLPEERNAGDW